MSKKRICILAAGIILAAGALFFAGCQTPEEIAQVEAARASARAVAAQKAAPTLNVPAPPSATASVVVLRSVSGTVQRSEDALTAAAVPTATNAHAAPEEAAAEPAAAAVPTPALPEDPYARRSSGTDYEMLSLGAQGELVSRLQQYLTELGYLPAAAVNGIFDDETEAAVKKLQLRNALVDDGIVGNSTWDLLLMANGRPAA